MSGAEARPQRMRKLFCVGWAEPFINVQHSLQKWHIFFEPANQSGPIHLRSMFVDEIENVGPIAAIALDDVKFAPQKLFRRDQEKTFPTNVHLRCIIEPVIVDGRALIRHGPDDVHDDILFMAAVNPCSVVRQLLVIKIGRAHV